MKKENIKNIENSNNNEIILESGNYDKEFYFEIIQELCSDTLFSLDIKTKVLTQNGDRAKEFGLPPIVEDFPMSMVSQGVIYPDDLSTFIAYAYDMLSGNGGTHEVRIRGNDETFHWVSVKAIVLKNKEGEAVEVLGRIRNIQEEKQNEARTSIDTLTKIQNLFTFEDNVEFDLANSKNGDEHLFLFVDLDDFKYINDTYGRDFGDFILTSLADRIQNRVQQTDYVGRIGGDEFGIFMKGISGLETIEKRVGQLINELRNEYSDGNHSHVARVSIGVARYPFDATNYRDLYEKSGKALYCSKDQGKDMATIYSEIHP